MNGEGGGGAGGKEEGIWIQPIVLVHPLLLLGSLWLLLHG